MPTTAQTRAVEIAHARALARHLLLFGAYAMLAASAAMLVAAVLLGVFSGDFPGRWLVAVAGAAAAGAVLRQGARSLPDAPRLSAGA